MKDIYTCPYCGTNSETPAGLAHCILSCEEKIKAEEQKRYKEELELAREAREKEIEEKAAELNELIHTYLKDYGSYYRTFESKETHLPYLYYWYF